MRIKQPSNNGMANETSNESEGKEIRTGTPREDLINTAVKFLQNPNVQRSALSHKQAFLKKKGLTDEEISIACQRAGTYSQSKNHGQLETMLQQSPQIAMQPQPYILPSVSPWSKLRHFLETVAIIGGVTYGLYILYKKYIEPFLFGIENKQKSIQDSMADLTESLNKLHEDLEQVKQQQLKQSSLPEFTSSTSKQLQELKSEMATIKGILLSRHQFPTYTPPKTSPSIPAWQMTSSEQQQTHDEAEEGQKEANAEGDIEVSTSGSGCSENEVVVHTGSDSSLEMIRE